MTWKEIKENCWVNLDNVGAIELVRIYSGSGKFKYCYWSFFVGSNCLTGKHFTSEKEALDWFEKEIKFAFKCKTV